MPTRSSVTVSSASPTMPKAAGVDGVLVVDYPPEECEAFAALLEARGIDLIFLIAPTSSDAAHRQRRQVGRRIRLPCLAQGRDGCRPLRHRRRHSDDPAHQGTRETTRRRRLRHPRCGDGTRRFRSRRRGRHRQRAGAAARRRVDRRGTDDRGAIHGRDPGRARRPSPQTLSRAAGEGARQGQLR